MKSLIYKILFLLFIVKFAFAIPQPGEKYFVDINKLPEPYSTKSVANSYKKSDVESCKLNAQDGFKVNIFAKNLQHPRNIKVSNNGDIFIVESNSGKIKVLRDTDGDGVSDINQVFAEGFNYPFGIEITPKYLYIADLDYVWKIPYKEGQLKSYNKHYKYKCSFQCFKLSLKDTVIIKSQKNNKFHKKQKTTTTKSQKNINFT